MPDPTLKFFEIHRNSEVPAQEHLAFSSLCDGDHPSLVQLRSSLFTGLKAPSKIVEASYDFIRREVLYAFDAWEVAAHETYEKAQGMCFNKTNLMIALLRGAKIPCRYAAFWIEKRGFSLTSAPEMFAKISPVTLHVYTEAYLGGKIGWRRYVDTSLDPKLRRALEPAGYRPHAALVLARPIERFSSPEALVEWRRRYKEAAGFLENITREEMEASNQKMEDLRQGKGPL